MAPPKRKSPPPPSSSTPNLNSPSSSSSITNNNTNHNKRQKLNSPSTLSSRNKRDKIEVIDSTPDLVVEPEPEPEVQVEIEEEDGEEDDSLSSLSPAPQSGEDEEEEEEEDDDDDEEEEMDVSGQMDKDKVRSSTVRKTGREDDEDEEEEDDHDDDDGEQVKVIEHPVVSAKSVATTTSSSSSSSPNKAAGSINSMNRSSIGGKGKKGEQAVRHAVEAREQVEKRRIELKGSDVENPLVKELDKEILENLTGEKIKEAQEADEGADDPAKKKKDADGKDKDDVDDDEEEPPPLPKRERPAFAEERANVIQFRVVTNDSKPDSMIILTGLKNLFQKQLPKMPREYIARLVFDRAHWSMAIVKRGLEVVGGVTFRPFEGQKFAEIVFFAVTGTEQVKGYGSHLMNHLKDYVKTETSCMHFLTYADNYAIGYFKKQGFTKEIQLDRSVWAGYIKDYEGGTIMHCAMIPRVRYLEVAQMLAKQKEVILAKIRVRSQSHIVHPGLQFWKTAVAGTSIDPSLVPGLKESGWTPEMEELTRRPKRGPQFAVMKKLLTLLIDHPSSWAFASPVNAAEVTDYYDVIKEPMDLATMENKLEANSYSELDEFLRDAQLIFDNCRQYNDPGSNYVKNANKLESYLREQTKIYHDP